MQQPEAFKFAEYTWELHQIVFSIIVVLVILGLIALYIYDRSQKEHTILRNYPIFGHLRYIFEAMGIYIRAYFTSNDREELPFNRAERDWVYRAAKNISDTIGFGSTRDIHPVGTVFFVDAPFPVLGQDAVVTRPITIGPNRPQPYTPKSLFNISAMSYGALSKNAVLALSEGAKMADCWMNTGEGGISPYHLAGGADLVAQIGTAKYGYCNAKGQLDDDLLKEAAAHPQVKMFEIKLSQGAKPGKGGVLLGMKVTPEIAAIRHIPAYTDSTSPNRFPEIGNCSQLLDFINHVRDVTGKPVGFKTVLGSYEWLDDLFTEIIRRGVECAPDFITLDGSEGGSGAAPLTLVDYVGLPITESLPVLVDIITEYGLRSQIKIIAAGKLITPAEATWALCVGADFVNSARGFLFALGCIQALRCHNNTCPTGITTHNPRLVSGLDPASKAYRVANYATNMSYEVGTICHSCGVKEPRELQRKHARIVMPNGLSIPLSELYPDKEPEVKMRKVLAQMQGQ